MSGLAPQGLKMIAAGTGGAVHLLGIVTNDESATYRRDLISVMGTSGGSNPQHNCAVLLTV